MTSQDSAGAEQPRYGQRVSPEELEAILREQGIEPNRPSATGDPRPAVETDPYLRAPGAGPAVGGFAPATGWAARPAARPRRRRGLLITGLVLLLALPLALGATALALSLGGVSTPGATLGEDGRVYLEAGEPLALYRAGVAVGPLDCTVTDPAGAAVATHTLESTGAADVAYLTFTPETSGTYSVTCASGTADVVVGPALNEGRILISGMLLFLALASAAVGLVLTIIGLVRR